ncbi:MAG: DUF2142 domain-containing protein [Lachnospiraceae bacterium]|nr:DUF2142 domain-containing protein [Lachnospiraceae bacterium]
MRKELKFSEKPLFLFYISIFLIVAGTLAFFQPHFDSPPLYGNPPDEHAKYLIPRYICEYGVIPTGFEEEIRLEGYGFSYAFYNVLPYIIQGYFMRLVNFFTTSELALLYAGRFINILSGTLMAIIVYKLANRLFYEQRMRWLFCFLIMFLPQSLFTHTYINTDSFALLSSAMICYAWVLIYQEGYNRRSIIFLSGGIIICALSYYNAYGFILSSILLFLSSFLEKEMPPGSGTSKRTALQFSLNDSHHNNFLLNEDRGKLRYDWKNMLIKGSIISGIVLLGIGWWFVRSFFLYDGDIIGFETRDKMAVLYGNPNYMDTYQAKGFTIWQMLKMNDFFSMTFNSFVAGYGSLAIFANIWLYRLYLTFLAVGILAYFLIKKGDKVVSSFKGKIFFFHLNMIFCAILPLILLIYYAYSTDYQAQGRYLLPGIIPLMYYVTAGFEKITALKWIPERWKGAGVIMACLFIISCLLWMVYRVALPVYLEIGVVY